MLDIYTQILCVTDSTHSIVSQCYSPVDVILEDEPRYFLYLVLMAWFESQVLPLPWVLETVFDSDL